MSNNIVQFNEEIIKGQIKELVRGSVEETLNELLEAEAQKLTQAARYERSEARQGYRSGHYDRKLTTTSGDVTLHVPRLKGISFETAIIERYRRRESSVEEALIEMYLAGVSVRRVEDITEALWGSKVGCGRSISGGQVSTVYCPFLPECILCGTQIQGEECGKNAQGDPCPREQESGQRQGESGDCGTEGHEAAGGGKEGGGRN